MNINSLGRFIKAQANTYKIAMSELKHGKKRTHWMWFIFPQLRGLGMSSISRYYGLEGIEEARAYLDHPVLSGRLYEACNEFIETLKGPITLLSSATGGANTFTLVGLNSLQFVLSAYKVSMSSHIRDIDYTALALNEEDGALINQWVNIKKGKRFWNRKLTYEHIMGTNVNSDLKLPSLPSIVAEYPRLSDQGKAFAGEYILERLGNETIIPVITVDCVVSLLAVNESFAESLSVLEPYGAENPEPTILLKDVFITKPQIVGSGHVKCVLTSSRGGYLKAISFRCADNDVGNTILNTKGEAYNIIGKVKLDEWQGRRNVQFIIEDISLG